MKANNLKKTVKVSLSIGLASLALILLELFLTSGRPVVATAPITGDPVSTEGASTILTAGDGVTAVVAADLDNDGRVDLALNDGSDVRIVANENTTETVFWPLSTTVVSMSAPVADLAATDFDRDGLVDLVVATADGLGVGELRLLCNPTSASPFTTSWSQSQTLTSTVQFSLTTIAAGDLDGDGAPDLVSAGGDGVIRLWHSPLTDTRDFATAWGSPVKIITNDGEIAQLVLADIDRDGRLDIVAISGGSTPRVRAWRNPGTPFSSAWSTTNLLANLNADGLSLVVSDLDHDDALDVAAGTADGSVLAWCNPLTGAQPFDTSWGGGVTVESGTGPVETLQSADLDNDGSLELIRGTGGGSPSLLVWHSRGVPFAGEWLSHTVGTPSRALQAQVVVDFDCDGDVDLVSGDTGALLHWPNTLVHRNAPFGDQTLVGQHNLVTDMAVGDLDRDGLTDLVTVRTAGSDGMRLRLWHNDGTPFASDWESDTLWFNRNIDAVALDDLDDDGDLDIVTGNGGSGGLPPNLYIWKNDGTPFDGGWTNVKITDLPNSFGDTQAMALATGDLDGDGVVDVIVGTGSDFGTGITDPVSRSVDFGVYACRNNGDPFSSTPWSTATLSVTLDGVNAVALGDLDGDGWLDVVVGANHAPAVGTVTNPMTSTWPDVYSVRAFYNDGTPFDSIWPDTSIGRDPETYTYAGGPVYHGFYGASTRAVVVTDLDNDGDLDVASGDGWEADYQVKVWENDGTPFDGDVWHFSATGLGPWWDSDGDPWLNGGVRSLTVGDINQDGLVDLVSGLEKTAVPIQSAKVVYWENSGIAFGAFPTDTHWIRHDVGEAETVKDVIAADLESDGDLDLATAIRDVGNPNVYVWQNQGGAVGEYLIDTAPAEMLENTQDDLMRVVVTHNGKWVDHDVELNWWRLTLADDAGTPLSGAQAANLFDDMRVYRDDGDGVWDPSDTLVVSVAVTDTALGSGGLLTVTFPAGDPLTTLSITQHYTYFVVATLQSDASMHEPSAFQVTFDPDAASLVKDHTTLSSVSIEDTDPITVGPVSISAGPPVNVSVIASSSEITADGSSTALITATVTNALAHPVDDGTVVSLTASLGTIAPPTSTTVSGAITATLTSSTTLGTAIVTATAEGVAGDTGVQFVPDVPDQVVATAWPSSIVADGTSTAVVTATVTDAYGHFVSDGTNVAFVSTLGSISPSSLTSGGVATSVLTSSIEMGTALVTATAGGVSDDTSVQFVSGPPSQVVVTAWPDSVVADGSSTAVVTATVTDAQGHSVDDGTVVSLTASLGTIAPPTSTTVSGAVTATLTSSTTLGTAIVTATAEGAAGDTGVQFVPDVPDQVVATAWPSSIVADGTSTAVVTTTITDAYGHFVSDGTSVAFVSTLGSISPSSLTSGGVATSVLTSSIELGTALVTATAGGVSDDTNVQFIPGALTQVLVTATPGSIVADGTSTAIVTATAVDTQGHPISSKVTVNFTTTLGSIAPPTRITSGAVATAVLTSSADLGTAVVTATAEAVSGDTSVQFTPGPPNQVVVTAWPTTTVADGSSTAIVTATVTDAWGRPVGDGTNVAFNSTLGTISPSVLTVGGVATATLDSSPENELGTAVITATAGGAAGQTSVWFVVGPLAQILVTAQPSELTADGASTALITATLTDGGGHLITETTTVTFSATLGAVFPLTKTTSSGIVTTTLQASDTKGTATIIALVDDISGQTSVAFTDFYIYLPLTIRNGPSS